MLANHDVTHISTLNSALYVFSSLSLPLSVYLSFPLCYSLSLSRTILFPLLYVSLSLSLSVSPSLSLSLSLALCLRRVCYESHELGGVPLPVSGTCRYIAQITLAKFPRLQCIINVVVVTVINIISVHLYRRHHLLSSTHSY